jgi:hypothetical protein
VRLLACGGVRIAGTVHLLGEPAVLRVPRFVTPAAVLLEEAVIAVLAAGDIHITGSVRTQRATPADASPLTLLAAGRMHLHGELPFQTLLAVESPPPGQDGPIVGTRGQASVAPVSFRYGAAVHADLWMRGCTPWQQMPPDRDGGRVQFEEAEPGLQIAWQTAPADPVSPTEPDRRIARHSQPQPVLDGDAIGIAPGSFVRFEFAVHVHPGTPLPSVREVRLIER